MSVSSNPFSAAVPTMITPSAAYLDQLDRLALLAGAKKRGGYVTGKLTDAQLQQKKRCVRCGARPFRKFSPSKARGNNAKADQAKATAQPTTSGGVLASVGNLPSAAGQQPAQQRCCMFHPGSVEFKKWTCCGKHVSEKTPCTGEDDHLLPEDPEDCELKKRWQYYETPAQAGPDHRLAVAIDCEMGTAMDGENELIRLSVVDYFSGTTLVDSLVYPDVEMHHFNTKWSGVTRSQMEKARRQRQCLMGVAAARSAVFKYVGQKTFVMGHGMSNDFMSLRWYHDRLVDSVAIESDIRKAAERKAEQERKRQAKAAGVPLEEVKAENKPVLGKGHPDGTSLKALALKRLGRRIQEGKGHDSLEDAVAARDLVHSYILEMNPQLAGWAPELQGKT